MIKAVASHFIIIIIISLQESREALHVKHDVAKIVRSNISVEAMRYELIYYELLKHTIDSYPACEPTA